MNGLLILLGMALTFAGTAAVLAGLITLVSLRTSPAPAGPDTDEVSAQDLKTYSTTLLLGGFIAFCCGIVALVASVN